MSEKETGEDNKSTEEIIEEDRNEPSPEPNEEAQGSHSPLPHGDGDPDEDATGGSNAAAEGFQEGPPTHPHAGWGGYPPWMNPAFMPYWNGGAMPPPPPPGWEAYGPGFMHPPPPMEASGYHHHLLAHPRHHPHLYPGIPPPHMQAAVNASEFREFLAWQHARAQGKDDYDEAHSNTRKGAASSSAKSPTATTQPRKKKKKTEKDAAKSLILLTGDSATNATGTTVTTRNKNNSSEPPPLQHMELDAPWADLCEGAELVTPALRGDISDALYVSMAQFRPCGLTQDDRVGKYKNREIGFVGMCCKHCGG
jgi:hypothetical protein